MTPTRRTRGHQYLIDNSVWARVPTSAVVRARVAQIQHDHEIVTATPQVLEAGFSARNPTDWDAIMDAMGAFTVLSMSARTHDVAIDVQGILWRSGKVRAAGAFDTLLVAIAIQHDAIVLHYDADYEHIASVEPRLRQEWVAPRGSL